MTVMAMSRRNTSTSAATCKVTSVLVGDGQGNGTLTDFDANGIELGYSILTNDGSGDTTTTNFSG